MQLVLRDVLLVERIAVSDGVEVALRVVVRHLQQEDAAVARVHRARGHELALGLQLAQVGAVHGRRRLDFLDGAAIADNGDGVHARDYFMIRILITGGTFDKEYDEITGRLFFKDTHVPEMLDARALARASVRSAR